MLVDLLVSLLKTVGAGLLKLWWIWLFLIIFSIIIILLKRKKTSAKQSNNLNLNNKCPKCEGYLKKVSGKYGPFFGCSNFPKCTYKQKL